MREKLIELIQSAVDGCATYWAGLIADRLIANGVTIVTDNNVGGKWIPVSERLPKAFISVLICVHGERPLPTVKSAYLANGQWRANLEIFDPEEVTHWMPLPEPPKEG